MTLTEFLLARIAEDEVAARGSQGGDWSTGGVRMVPQPEGTEHWSSVAPGWVLVEPNHVLAECEAKRRVVEMLSAEERSTDTAAIYVADALREAVRAIALPYRSHPEWREEWKP